MSTELLHHYLEKPSRYYREQRDEMLSFVPASCRRVLDVGCGVGAFGEIIKRSRQAEVWGIEPVETAAAEAKTRLDQVLAMSFARGTSLDKEIFDCIVFNDVLEHLVDPIAALEYARSLLGEDGVIVASIPNIRHFPTLWRLCMHGEWTYRQWGTLDRTHLRFFTRSTIMSSFEDCGFTITQCEGINPYAGVPNVSRNLWRAFKLVDRISGGVFTDMKFQQFAVVAGLRST